MEKSYIEEFRSILRRLKASSNCERYNSICTKPSNADEKRIWKLCEAFWHPDYEQRTSDIEKYEPNPNLDSTTAEKYLKELTQLLDKLGWNKES